MFSFRVLFCENVPFPCEKMHISALLHTFWNYFLRYIYICDRVSRINKNDRSASDLIKLSVFQLHVIEMQLLEHQCTNACVYLCMLKYILHICPRENIRWNARLRLNRITISSRFGFPRFMILKFAILCETCYCTYLCGLTLNNEQTDCPSTAFNPIFCSFDILRERENE